MRKYKPSALYQTIQAQVTTPKGKTYGTVTVSLATTIFFVIFAIRPTLLTIVSLKRQVSDLKRIDEQIKEKIDVLSRLSFAYRSIEPDMPIIEAAVPTRTHLSQLITSLNSATSGSLVELSRLTINNTPLTSSVPETSIKLIKPQLETIAFTVTYLGQYEDLLTTLENLNRLDRLALVDEFSLNPESDKSDRLVLTVKGRVFNLSLN